MALALSDLIAPYFLLGRSTAPLHPVLDLLEVDAYDATADALGAVVRGRARFGAGGDVYFDPRSAELGSGAPHPRDDAGRRDPWIDISDTTVDFELSAPRQAGASIVAAQANLAATTAFANTRNLLAALDPPPVNALPTDYPSTAFTLDLLITSAVIRAPFLHPARLREDGRLEPDPDRTSVALLLPRILLRMTQPSVANPPFGFVLLSAGASGLDDPGDPRVEELVRMDPPYAFIGPGNLVGFGFRSAVLDLSANRTPPEVLAQFGYDAAWTGVYLPEIRLFLAPQGAEGLAVDAGARNLLIGLGATPGVTGDFALDIINQGTAIALSARFYDAGGTEHGITRLSEDTAEVTLPERATMVVDVSGGRPPYAVSVTLDGEAAGGRVVDVSMADATERTIVVRADTTELTITARRRPPPPVPSTPVPPARVTQADPPGIVIAAQTDTTVTLALADGATVAWTVDGGAVATAARVTVPLAAGTEIDVRATAAAVTNSRLPIYFHFDQPPSLPDADLEEWTRNPANTNTTEAVDDPPASGWTAGGGPVESDPGYARALAALTGPLRVAGHASSEDDPAAEPYNRLLSERRAKAARFIYERLAPGICDPSAVDPHGTADAVPAQAAGSPRRQWWRAELPEDANVPELVYTATVARAEPAPDPPPEPVDPPPETPEKPPWLRALGLRVRVIQDQLVAVELNGEIDLETAAEEAFRGPAPGADPPSFFDGIVEFRGVFTLDPGQDEWALDVTFGADPADVDGLATAADGPGRDLLGLYSLLLPLIAEAAPESPADATVGDLVLTGTLAALPVTLAETGWMSVERWILYGGEVLTLQRDGAWSTSVLLDVETAVSADIRLGNRSLVTIDRERPLVARYKAIGFRFGRAGDGDAILQPVFDSSRGYTLDIARGGSLTVAEPLGSILRVVSARVSRTNPVMLEVELAAAVDLGVIALETCAIRAGLDDLTVELTALGASVDIPGAISGSGYFQIAEAGFAGRIDLTITPISLRVSGAISVQSIPGATAVAIALEVRFPVAIPLANSGMGIYGLLGLFAMHFERNETLDAASATPALNWLARAQGDPTRVDDPDLWAPAIDHWAFGVGAIVGTMGSSVLFNMKGVVLLELPGPRVLLMMKANLLAPMPALGGTSEGTLLAVVDLDVAGGSLTIGIVVDYGIEPLLRVHVPIEAFFDTDAPEQWHLYAGKPLDPVSADVLGVFSGTGYLMLVGDGGTNPDLPAGLPRPAGFAVATGLHVSMLWGSKPAGIYAELAAGFDAILGFTPLLVAGTLSARGQMRLVVASIAAHADMDVRLGELADGRTGYEIEGEVCGSIDLFFFDIEACVDFRLESGAPPDIAIPPLVSGVSLIARSPALVQGTATDEPVDAALADAATANADLPVVPIDAIPVVMFGAPPFATGVTFEDAPLNGASGGRTVHRSDDAIAYTLTAVELLGPLGDGARPATWWTLRPPTEANESAQLALLSWVPDPTPKALQASDRRDETVTDRWGSVCDDAAPPAPVLWTFRGEPLGPDARGWTLTGEAWPDPEGTQRSEPPPLTLGVSERWRSGDPVADRLRGIAPAEVIGALVDCPGGSATLEPAVAATEILHRLDTGVAVPRSSLFPGTVVATPAGPACESRILAAPRFDTLAPVPPYDRAKEREVRARWQARDFAPGDLACAVVLRPGPFAAARLLLLVNPAAFDAGMAVRALDADGAVVDEHLPELVDAVAWATLPSRWTDPEGPWADDVLLVAEHLALLARDNLVPVLIPLTGAAETILIGADPDRNWSAPPFHVAAVEALASAERVRHDYDSSTVRSDRQALSASLGAESGAVALLEPDTTYEVRVTWSATASNSRGETAEQPGTIDRFWFRTAAEPPERLDPYVLAGHPYDGERHVFGAEPLQLSFATQDVVDLYAAFGDRLTVRLLAASGDHPDAAPLTAEPVAAAVLSPWEDAAVRLAAGLPCIDVAAERTRHSVATIPIPLAPSTDHLLDIERAPGARVYRRGFTTSAYGTLAGFAAALLGTRPVHRYAPDGGMAAVAAAVSDAPAGSELDDAFDACGIGRLPAPPAPQVLVFWEGTEPTAVVLDATEPLWRERERATLVALAGTDIAHWELERATWIEPEVTAGPVARVIRAPGGQRAVLLLAAARGEVLQVALRRHAFTEPYLDGPAAGDEVQPIVALTLARAPWEEDGG